MQPASLAAFLAALLRILHQYDGIIRTQTFRSMLQPILEERDGNHMGLGLKLSKDGDCFFHTGWNYGYRALLLGSLHEGNGVVAMASSDGGMDTIKQLLKGTQFTEALHSIR